MYIHIRLVIWRAEAPRDGRIDLEKGISASEDTGRDCAHIPASRASIIIRFESKRTVGSILELRFRMPF